MKQPDLLTYMLTSGYFWKKKFAVTSTNGTFDFTICGIRLENPDRRTVGSGPSQDRIFNNLHEK